VAPADAAAWRAQVAAPPSVAGGPVARVEPGAAVAQRAVTVAEEPAVAEARRAVMVAEEPAVAAPLAHRGAWPEPVAPAGAEERAVREAAVERAAR
jgi:hypothetical protein